MATRQLVRGVAIAACVLALHHVHAQTPTAPGEAAALAEARALLSQGNVSAASAQAARLQAQFPKSPAVLQLAVETETLRAGSAPALAIYERWAEANKAEDPPALRIVAAGALRELARAQLPVDTRIRILKALAADGDADAAAMLAGDSLRQEAGPVLLASAGNDQAITDLLAQLQNAPVAAARKRAIEGLANSRSRRALAPLIAALNDQNMDVRAAAAQGLGRLGMPEAVGPLKTLLNDPDPVFPVRYQAAMALLELKDLSGLSWLRQLESDPEPGLRLAGVQATRTQPDGSWLAVVRELAKDKDRDIRRQAAELLAEHDPAAAKAALEPLVSDGNPVERDLATRSLVQSTDDLPVLRRYLKAGNADLRALAAIRTLEVAR
jgi:HEAT repeat protein